MGHRRIKFAFAVTIAVATTVGLLGQTQSTRIALSYFPATEGDWEVKTPESLGWNTAALDDAFSYAAQEKSTALLILHDGRRVAERYWRSEDVPRVASSTEGWPVEDVQSLQKSFISLLVGIAVDRNLLDRQAPVSKYIGTGWSRTNPSAEREITVNHLLSMTSGLNDSLEFVGPVGSRWYYNTPAYSQLIKVLAAVTKKDVNTYSHEWLTSAIGMRDTRWIMREATAPNPYGLATTARDLARMALLVLRRGMWTGKQVVSETYLSGAVHSSQMLNPTYGLLWWVNGRSLGPGVQRSMDAFYSVPAAPADLVAGLGAGDRKVYIVPSLKLVIVRLGSAVDGPARRFDRDLWDRMAQAIR